MILLQACVHLLCTTNTCVSNRVIRHDIVVEGVTFKKKYYYVRVHKKLFLRNVSVSRLNYQIITMLVFLFKYFITLVYSSAVWFV